MERGSGANAGGSQSYPARLGLIAGEKYSENLQMSHEGLGVSEVLEVGVSRHQVVGAQHISSAFRLPDHFQGHEFTGGC